jgi:antitoxin ChpS
MATRAIADKTGLASRTTLKKSGGSLVMTVPARARDALHLTEGQELTVSVDGSRLVLEPSRPARPAYSLDQLLADCDFGQPYSDEERAWLDAPPAGRELL